MKTHYIELHCENHGWLACNIFHIFAVKRKIFLLVFSAVFVCHGFAFELVKDIHNVKQMDEVVLFEKGKPADHLIFIDDTNCKLSFTPDGSIECRIIGDKEIKPLIKWKPKQGLPASFCLKNYDYIIMTCRMEGANKSTNAQGKETTQRGGNLWFGFGLYAANGDPLGSASLADVTEDQATPDKTVTLKFPMELVKFWSWDPNGEVTAIGFPWSSVRAPWTHDYRFILDKIAFATVK